VQRQVDVGLQRLDQRRVQTRQGIGGWRQRGRAAGHPGVGGRTTEAHQRVEEQIEYIGMGIRCAGQRANRERRHRPGGHTRTDRPPAPKCGEFGAA
jgi:hypothetical protein